LAVNKRKVLDAARKYAQKGAKEKALKEYHTLLKLDPRDAKLHLEIGDCYRRWGQVDEAITQYARVADQYKQDGFDARAVAVFKQILNLDPKGYDAYVSLSELYQRMGLDAEALTALQSAADGYHREGKKREALELLRKMATLDPTNTTSRLKVAELLRQEGMDDDAVAEYEAVAAELERQGASESILTVRERILELQPDRNDIRLGIARSLIELRKPERAESFARQAIDADPEQSEAYEALCDIYKALGNDDELAKTTGTLAKLYRDQGDEGKARELAQRIPLGLEFDSDESAPVDETDSSFLGDDDLLDEDFLATDNSEVDDASEELPLDADDELELELDEDDAADQGVADQGAEEELLLGAADHGSEEADDELDLFEDDESESESTRPEGDPDQLLAEASVYLRYGKRKEAIASLEVVLEQEPEHRAALEKLGDAHAENDDDDQAVEMWSRAAQRARSDGDDEGFAVLRDRITALDAAAGALLVDVPDEPQLVDIDDIVDSNHEANDEAEEFEIDVSVGDDESEDETEDETEDESEADSHDATASAGIELDLSAEEDEEDEEDDHGIEIDLSSEEDEDDDDEIDVEVEVDVYVDLSGDTDEAEEDALAASGPASSANSATTSQQVAEDLEEADFYYQQELFAEAESIYRRILKVAPNHPGALLRLGELAAAKGDDPTAVPPAAEASRATLGAQAPGEDSTEVADLILDVDEEDEPAVNLDLPPARQVEAARGKSGEQKSRADDTVPIEVAEPEAETEQPVAAAEEPVQAEEAEDAAAEEEGGFDLAAELRDVIEEDDPAADSVDGRLSTVDDGFESIFADFKQGVSAALSGDDYETRYDLGIAYREMELYQDAIGEFSTCLNSPKWKLSSLHLMGLCALDLGRATDAANHIEQALSSEGLPEEQIAGLQFDLGRAYEVAGDLGRARSAYASVVEADPGFPGVAERIERLASAAREAPVELEDDAGDEGFESFDDLVAEAQADDAVEETESFESFDDIITEADAVIAEPLPEVETETEVVAEAEEQPSNEWGGWTSPDGTPTWADDAPQQEQAEDSKSSKKRKKKISFV
jgi:tetratricopeptide (TPR) repeat protein